MRETIREWPSSEILQWVTALIFGFSLWGCDEGWSEIEAEQNVSALKNEGDANETGKGDIEEGMAEIDPEEMPYRHPMLQDGLPLEELYSDVPLKPTDGTHLAIVESISSDEEGYEEKFSGVIKLETRELTNEELDEILELKDSMFENSSETQFAGVTYLDKIGPELGVLLSEAVQSDNPSSMMDDSHEVVITSSRREFPTVAAEIENALAKGEIATYSDYYRVKKDISERRQARVAEDISPLLNAITDGGGNVLFTPKNIHSLIAKIPLGLAKSLAKMNDVAHIELNSLVEDEISHPDGNHIIAHFQIKQFIDDGFDGENLSNRTPDNDITFAQTEGMGANDEHVGFREDTSTYTRIRGRYNCTSSGCSSVSNFSQDQENYHATGVAGTIFGDLRDGQDSNYTSSYDRIARSGYAGEAKGWLFRGNTISAHEHIAGMTGTTAPVVVNMSAGSDSADTTCLGRDSRSLAANEIFESGKLLFKSAGNDYHESTTDCTVTSPGSAIGVFTVGGTGNPLYEEYDDITSYSSRGGTSTEGGGRTIVDMTACTYRLLEFDMNGEYDEAWSGTSISAPVMTATAIDFIDFYKSTYSNLIDDPGVLFSNLLLMGDRMSQTGFRRVSGFGNLYGAGRLRARRWDSSGMDTPYAWATIRTCIDDGEVHTVAINNGNTISSDVESFKAVVWWYDSRHDNAKNPRLDDIDLYLKTTAGASLRHSVTGDNKERVFYDVGGKAVKLQVIGTDVTADNEGCGTNSMRVFISYYYEDTDRDDGDGPGSEIEIW